MAPAVRTIRLLAVLAVLGLAGCATPFTKSQTLAPHYQIGVAEGVRLAAQAAQEVGYLPSVQNEAAGFVTAEQQRKDTFNLDMFTLYLNVRFARDAAGGLRMESTCAVSQNIAYTDELDDECGKFDAAFHRLLDARVARHPAPAGSLRATPQPGTQAPVQPQPPMQPPPPPQPRPAQRDYQL